MSLMETNEAETADVAYIQTFYKMEIERLKFVITSYLRCRLTKVMMIQQIFILLIHDRLRTIGCTGWDRRQKDG